MFPLENFPLFPQHVDLLVEQAVSLLLEAFVGSAVQRELPSLLKSFFAPVEPAHKRFITCMCVGVLLQILWKSKVLFTELALVLLLFGVDVVVAFQGKARREALAAALKGAAVNLQFFVLHFF